MKLGMETPIRPIAPIEANMERFSAGQVSFGVEYRLLNKAITSAHMAEHTAEQIAANTAGLGGQIDTSGVSIHVFGPDGCEYLRFDCFDDGPHYHYIDAGSPTQRIIAMDLAANGEALAWTMSRLRTRLAPMLEEAGGAAVAREMQPQLVSAALEKVEAAALKASKAPA
jgi:hypothetical protein